MNMKRIHLLLTLLFLTISIPTWAQGDDPDPAPGDPGAVPVAPVDQYVPFTLIAVVGLSYILLARKKELN